VEGGGIEGGVQWQCMVGGGDKKKMDKEPLQGPAFLTGRKG